MKNFLFVILFLLFSCVNLFAQKIEFEEFDLENGLHVILHQDNSNPIVVVSVLYHVGSKNENPERTGFAHFFEHLMFEGSENIKRGEFDKYVKSCGGTNNAFTTQDITYYYEKFPSNHLALGLWIESERMLHAKVDNKGIETQREVVKEEKRMRLDNSPYAKAFTTDIPGLVFKNHPYKWSVIGSMDHLNAASEEDYKNFYKDFYNPNNATLCIAGDFDVNTARKLVEDYFSDIPKGNKIQRPNAKEEPITSEIFKTTTDKNIQLPAVAMVYRIPDIKDEDNYVLNMISNILVKGESSRFNKIIKNEKQLALKFEVFPMSLEDYGMFIAFGLPNQGVEIETLTAAMDEELEKLKLEGIDNRELQKQINKLELNFLQSNASLENIAQSLSNNYVMYNNTNLINKELEKYRKITVEDVKRVANKYLNKNQRLRLNIVP